MSKQGRPVHRVMDVFIKCLPKCENYIWQPGPVIIIKTNWNGRWEDRSPSGLGGLMDVEGHVL